MSRAIHRNLVLGLFLAVLLQAAGGCVSAPFERGIRDYVPTVTKQFRKYVKTDANLDTDTKARRLSAADALDTAATERPMNYEHVRDAWQGPEGVREPHAEYVDADPQLEPSEKSIRAENLSRVDRLIEVEGSRWIYGGQ